MDECDLRIRYILLMDRTELHTSKVRYEIEGAELPYVAEAGVVYTRPWVVDLVLDLAGYDPAENLVDSVVVEPSCGDGEFLGPMVRRLSSSCRRQERPLRDCEGALLAFDLDPEAVAASRERVESVLVECGWDKDESREMAHRWVREADFLLDQGLDMAALGGGVGFVIGNPPYVRLESIDPGVAELYRKRYRTMTHRADLYVGFFERALNMLAPGGVCAFICADRWMLNQYGSKLRELVTTGGYAVDAVVEMHRADAFHDEVLAYPAITTIRRSEEQGRVLVANVDRVSGVSAGELVEAAREVRQGRQVGAGYSNGDRAVRESRYAVVDEWFEGSDPWPNASPERLKLLKRLEAEFPPLEDESTGTKVHIGLASGADKVFLTKDPVLVEEDRLLPMAKAEDTMSGVLDWAGHYLVSPWEPDGSLVDLGRYPRLRRYFEEHEEILKGRSVAKKNPLRWWRTTDKVHHDLTHKPKLLITDIKSVVHPVYDEGRYYPHHNLYHVTSKFWDLKVLGGLLLSRVCQFFIECYAVRMSGGYLRFQAQCLRRIRIPRPSEINEQQAEELRRAFDERDAYAATKIALSLYDIDTLPG